MNQQHRYLGYGGLIPFVILGLASLADISHARWFLLSYAALIFSFLGGILWGQSLIKKMPVHCSLVSVSCMLWAWLWLLLPAYNWLWLAALSFVTLWLYEWLLLRPQLDPAFIRMRGQLSSIAALSLVLANF